jgi:acyl-coenzyme A synthetase/AMP-(fatty) acid ligase
MEEQLRAHPWVQDVAVVGVPDETWGERAVAVVMASVQGRQALEHASGDAGEELRSWLKQRVASYQVPRSVAWKPELPRNTMSKVQKPELLRLLQRG